MNLFTDCVLYLCLPLIHAGFWVGYVYCSYDPLHPRELSRATSDVSDGGGGELPRAGALRDQRRATKKLVAIQRSSGKLGVLPSPLWGGDGGGGSCYFAQ